MKIQVRQGCFETNSSSVHSLTIASKEDYVKWQKGKTFFAGEAWRSFFVELSKFPTAKEVLSAIRKDLISYPNKEIAQYNITESDLIEFLSLKEWDDSEKMAALKQYLDNNEIYSCETWEQYISDYCYDEFEEHETTDGGEEVVGFGYYGRD